MLFLKRVILGCIALGAIYFGGSGTQGNTAFSQGVGFVGLIVGIVILYIFLKMAWRGLGCLPSFLIFTVIVIFILFAIGAFSNGVENIGTNLKAFLGNTNKSAVSQQEKSRSKAYAVNENMSNLDGVAVEEEDIFFSEEDLTPALDETAQTESNEASKKSDGGLFGGIVNVFSTEEVVEEEQGFNPNNLPSIFGYPRVINGDTIAINGKYLKLFGVDAPETNQTCSNKQGRSYYCGKESASWLSSWITNNEIECKIVKKDSKGNMIGICSLGQYDIGAALVNAGWAVADVTATDIYKSYEIQAQQNKVGLWQGRFYTPEAWRKLQNKKPDIKVIKPKNTKKGIFDL